MMLKQSNNQMDAFDPHELKNGAQLSALPIICEFSQKLLRDLKLLDTDDLAFKLSKDNTLLPEGEHLRHDFDAGVTYIRRSFFENIETNILLASWVIAHELYHTFGQGFGSYQEALSLIRAFSSSDVVRADVEADKYTFIALQKDYGISFENYCTDVMIPSSDLFGIANKSFPDFARFCSRALTLYGEIGAKNLSDSMVIVSCDPSGWHECGDTTRVVCQVLTETRTSFRHIEIPSNLVRDLKNLFWLSEFESSGGETDHYEVLRAVGYQNNREIMMRLVRECRLVERGEDER